MRRPAVLVLLLLAVLLVACRSGSDGSTGAADLTDDRTEAELATDRAAAEAALPVLDDFPPGWTAELRDDADDGEAPDLDTQLAECLGVDKALLGDTRVNVESDTFKFDDAEVEADVSMLPTKAYADEVVAVIHKPQARGCFEDVFVDVVEHSSENPAPGEALPEGVSFGDVRLVELDFPDVGQDSRAFRISMPIRLGLLAVDLYYDLVFFRVGRAMASISFLDSTTPFDEILAEDLARQLASKLPST